MDYFYTIAVLTGINLIAALGLHIITGMSGQFSLGHAAFMSIGAYTSAILTMHYDFSLFTSLIIGIIASAVLGYLISYPTTNLKGDYLALVTIGFGEIVRVILLNMDITNGALGMAGIPPLTTIEGVYLAVIIGILFIQLLKKSWFGRGLLAIRENEHAAIVMGINVPQYKRLSFAIGSAFAGCSGVFYAHYLTFISPGDLALTKSIEILLFLIIGGLGYVRGAIIGTVIMTTLPEFLRFIQDYRTIVYGVLLILLMIYRPDGIIGAIHPKKKWLPGFFRRSKNTA